MKTSIFKMTWRSIRTFFGRYMALLMIVALSAGFFSGLKITKDAMVNTADKFLEEQNFYDFRLFSTLGFTEEDIKSFYELSEVKSVEGIKTVDALMEYEGESQPFKLFSMPEEINLPSLTAGRMPSSDTECLADDKKFQEEDIGKVIRLADDNEESIKGQIAYKEYTIVGLVDSPLYMGLDRGSTSIGSGAIYAFLYLPKENFTGEYFTEIDITLKETASIYSDEYEELIENKEEKITKLCKELALKRYDSLLSSQGLTAELAEQMGISQPETYVLTREENAGYVSFENDTSIVSGVANIFPVFFILIAMLVCMTTMTRMVDEERTQIGVLKALGYSDMKIMAKYLLYAGSATVLGWGIGFFVCTWGLPLIFWFAYNALYDFAPLSYLFSPELAILTLVVSLAGILGSTFFSCRKELGRVPAKLIRPRTAKNGKRILLERITPFWNRLTFLQKITIRNMFRYKRRLIMMLVGISCCAGLVVTAFGVRDSMIDIGTLQFETIQTYDIEATFESGMEDTVSEKFGELAEVEDYLIGSVHRVDLFGSDTMNSVSMMSFSETDRVSDFWGFYDEEKQISLPEKGEAIINKKIAEKLSLSVGDSFEIRNVDMQTCTVTVSGIFDNYIYNFVVVSPETYTEAFGEWEANTAFIDTEGTVENTEDIAKKLTDMEEIKSVSQLSTTKQNVDSALSCLDYIIWLVVLFAGALAFIVIFNLTNINLAERSREIATVQVLGFYPKETESYVLRENLVLSILASFIGLPLGTLFHRIVMSMIVIDTFSFDLQVTPVSYVLSLICTALFAVIVNLFMKRHIGKICMTESLKAVE
ncbi:MAG: FtsX-like permease family protein [Lachnospiraceae bacterium]|nr:FtsX-like permease family protein [Lachnospiraceae bacterium]